MVFSIPLVFWLMAEASFWSWSRIALLIRFALSLSS
jgi:hypothetical protein